MRSRRFVSRAPLALPQWYRSHTCQEPSQATSFDSLRDGGSKTGSRNSEGLETTGFRALEKGLEKKGARSGGKEPTSSRERCTRTRQVRVALRGQGGVHELQHAARWRALGDAGGVPLRGLVAERGHRGR